MPQSTSQKNALILVVDDHYLHAYDTEEFLAEAGYRTASIARMELLMEETLCEVWRQRPRLVILDVDFNGKRQGITLAEKIREFSTVPILFHTIYSLSPDESQRVFSIGNSKLLNKSAPPDQLLAIVRELNPLSPARSKVFVSYSKWDHSYQQELQLYLTSAGVEFWADDQIQEGTNWKQEIGEALDVSKSAILLVSASFGESAFIGQVELPYLLEAAATEGLQLFPVLVSAVTKTALSKMHLSEQQFVKPFDLAKPWGVLPAEERKVHWSTLAERMAAL